MRMAFNIALIIGALIIGAVIVTWLYFVHTPPGRDFLKTRAESAAQSIVREQLNSELTIGELENGLPGRIAINDITLSADGEVWFEADRAVLVWNPFALLNRKVLVREFTLEEGDLYALPPLPEREETPNEEQEPFSLPQELPWIDIDRISISPLRVGDGIIGPARTIRAEGRFSTADNRLSSDLTITTGDNDDLVRALIGTNRRILTVDVTADGDEDGLINHFAQAGGPVSLALQGKGPLRDWEGTLVADVAAYGTADLSFAGDLAQRNAISLNGTVTPGVKWPEPAMEAAGESVALDIALETIRGRRAISINQLDGAFGSLTGTLNNIGDDGTLENSAADLILFLDRDYAETFSATPVAGENRLQATIDYSGEDGLDATGTLNTPAGRIGFDGLTYADDRLVGTISVGLQQLPIENETLDALFPRGLNVTTDLTYAESRVVAENLDLYSGQDRANAAILLGGRADYALSSERIAANGTLRLAPGVVSRFTDAVSFTGPLTNRFSVSGTFDQLQAELNADYASGTLSDRPFAAGNLAANFSGLPNAPTGTLSLRSADNSYRGTVDLAAANSDEIVARTLQFSAAGLSVDGTARYTMADSGATGRVTVETDGPVAISADRSVSGTANVEFETAMQGDVRTLNAEITASNIESNDAGVEALSLTVSGTDRDMDITLGADNVLLPNDYLVTRLETETGLARSDETITATIATFIARTGAGTPEETIRLLSPTTITYEGDTVSFTETRIDGFDRSEVTLAGLYSPQRWVLDASGSALRVPGLQSPLTFEIDLDTDEETPATLQLTSEVQDQNDEWHRLVLDGRWTGEAVTARATLRDSESDYPGTLDLTLPVILTRGESLGVDTDDGTISGQFNYDSELDHLIAFLPIDENFLTGNLLAEIDIGGTLAAPEVSGNAQLSGGRFEEPTTGAALNDMRGTLTFNYDATGSSGEFNINAADATGKADSFRLVGDVRLGESAGEDGSSIDGTLRLNRATLIQSSDLTVRASSDLSLTGSMREMLLEGDIDILNLDAVIPDTPSRRSYTPVTVVRVDGDQQPIEEEETEENGPTPVIINLDLAINADNEIYINGRGLQSEWQTDLSVTGTANDPVLAGNIQTVDGVFEFGGREFDITRGDIIFTEPNGLNPRLDIAASYETETAAQGDVTATIRVTGTAEEPNIRLTSTPTLPQEDIMSLVLFGKDPGQLSAYESLQIAQSVAALTATGPFGGAGITNSLRRSAGLDTLSFGQDAETGSGTLTVGKYVSDEVYVSATQGLGNAGSTVSVTYEFSDHITVETTLEQTGAQSVSANYKRDY